MQALPRKVDSKPRRHPGLDPGLLAVLRRPALEKIFVKKQRFSSAWYGSSAEGLS
jgi:hypothetical protein